MKRFILTILAALMIATAGAQTPIFQKYKVYEGVNTFHANRRQLRKINRSKKNDLSFKGFHLSGFDCKHVTDFRALVTINTFAGQHIQKDLRAFYNAHGFEELVRKTEGDETVTLYRRAGDTREEDETSFLITNGKYSVLLFSFTGEVDFQNNSTCDQFYY